MTTPDAGRGPEVSVVICTYNRAAGLASVLDDLSRQEDISALRWELLVIDNNSTDGTRALVEDRMAHGTLPLRYAFEGEQGKSRAMNRGIVESRGAIIVFTDDDVDIPSTWLAAILKPFTDPECMGVGGKVHPDWSVEVPEWASDSEPYRMMAAIVQYTNGRDARGQIAPPIGANCAFRREVFERHGNFRVDLGHSGGDPIPGEDIEFGRRLMHHGERIEYAPDAVMSHPVTNSRLTRNYFERWYFQRGRLEVALAPYELDPGVRRLAGVPRYLLRELPEWIFRSLTASDPRGRFYYKLRACMAAGAIREFYVRRQDGPVA